MTFFRDLTPYTYGHFNGSIACVNIGWLAFGQAYNTGPVSENMLAALWKYVRCPAVQHRGYHRCDLCQPSPLRPISAIRNGESVQLGSAEIRVFGPDGRVYAAPTMIYHYLLNHQYSPPAEFVTALMTGLDPESENYKDLLESLELNAR